MTVEQKVRAFVKQDEIPRAERPGTSKGYYLYIEDDVGCMIEQEDGTLIPNTDTQRQLPTDLIRETEAATYQVPEEENAPEDDAETISLMSTADYDREEVETSLTNISEAFHAIAQEYEKLTTTVPHMSKVQATQVVARLPILPILKQEVKTEKKEMDKSTEKEPAPNTSQDLPTANADRQPIPSTSQELSAVGIERQPTPSTYQKLTTTDTGTQPGGKPEVVEEPTVEKEDKPDGSDRSKYFSRYALAGKVKNPEEKVQEACKEINNCNLVVLIAVRDYIINQAIKEIAKKWGLSFSTVQLAMLRKKEHSMGRRQYAQCKRSAEQQETPAKKS